MDMKLKSEQTHKKELRDFFNQKLDVFIRKASNPLKVGDELASMLKNSEEEVAQKIIPRAVEKWASVKTRPKWRKIISDKTMAVELRIIGRSIANSMRPLAGNNFTNWIANILNVYFSSRKIPLHAWTSGPIKTDLSRGLVHKQMRGKGVKDYRPDIDIVLVRTDKGNKPVAIISAKTTLAERVMQTINWFQYLKRGPARYRGIKLFLVTAWENFESGVNKERVQELDGVYMCDKNFKEYGKIKRFSQIVKVIKTLSR